MPLVSSETFSLCASHKTRVARVIRGNILATMKMDRSLARFAALLLVASETHAAPGSLDPSFDSNGTAIADFGGFDSVRALAQQLIGARYLAAGTTRATISGPGNFALARFNNDGSPDGTFGSGGRTTTDFGANDRAVALSVRVVGLGLDETVVAVGLTDAGGDLDFAVARYDDTNGGPVTSFDGDGKVTTDFAGFDDTASAVAVQSDGRVVVAGYSDSGGVDGFDFALARYLANGTLDTSFDSDGKVTTQISVADQDNWATCMAIQPDGKILVGGYGGGGFGGGSNSSWHIARYHGQIATGTPGTLDTSFGSFPEVGIVDVILAPGGRLEAMTLQADGKIVLTGECNANVGLARLNADGSLDTGFNGTGTMVVPLAVANDAPFGVAVQADGKILVVGQSNKGGTDFDFLVARFTPSGALDPGFGNGGILLTDYSSGGDETARGVLVQGDGTIVVAGTHSGTTDDFLLARYLTAQGDVRVGTNAAVTRGNDLYNPTGAGQMQVAAIRRGGGMKKIAAGIQNDGPVPDSFTARGRKGNRKFQVAYLLGRKNHTAAMVRGTYATGPVAAGATHLQTVRITAATQQSRKKRTLFVSSNSANDPSASDTAIIQAKSR
jgi:uncharacterized delta-60 repeat protein